MIRSIKIIKNHFSRSRRRRQLNVDPKLKDLSRMQIIQQQVGQHRKIYQSKIPQKTILQTLNDPKPKLQDRFIIDTNDINKKLKGIIKKQLKLQRLQSGQDDQSVADMIGQNQKKSFIHNQEQEILFQQKFKKQIFKKKQVNRLLQKEKNDYRNYLQTPKDLKYLQYQENIKKLKNNRIQSMMNFQKNNQQLRLLIDSGYIDHPSNILKIMNQTNPKEKLLQHISQQETKIFEISQQNLNNQQNQLVASNNKEQSNQNDLHSNLMQNIQGPEQLRDKTKLQQFFQSYKQSSELQKQRTKKDFDLLHQIKQYEHEKFLSRYNDLNFRFKGQVDFTFMKQQQLLSYIKTQNSQKVFPENLVKIYTQNKQSLNKFNKPIITPAVMGRLYSTCSLYQFPQSNQNNRINMLCDKGFVDLQRNLFKNLQKLANEHFTDVVFAYAKNHKQQQGVIRSKMHAKIIQKIINQLEQRIYVLNEQDLGLILRSLTRLNIFQDEKIKWNYLIQALSQRISQIKQSYQYETIIEFLTLLPVSSLTIESIYKNIKKFQSYKWQTKQTFLSYCRGSAFLIRYKNLIPNYLKIRTLQELKHVILVKNNEIKQILPQLSINNYPQILSVFGHLSMCQPKSAQFEINIPQILINVSKKEITDNIHMQKQLIHKTTLGNISLGLSLLDYQNSLIKSQQFSYDIIPLMQVTALKSLFPFRPFTYNSSLYFIYHQLTKLTNSQIANLPVKSIVQTLFANSLVRYKNQGMFDSIIQKLLQKIQYQAKDYQNKQKVHEKYIKEYITLINSFYHNKRISQDYYYFLSLILNHGLKNILSVTPHNLIRFFQSIISLSFTNLKSTQDYIIIESFLPIFQLIIKHSINLHMNNFLKEELICLKFIISFFLAFKTQKKKNTSLLNQTLQNIQKKLSLFEYSFQEVYLVSLLDQLKLIISAQNQKLQIVQFSDKFIEIEQQYYNKIISKLEEEQQHIGSQFSYSFIINKIKNKLVQQNVQIKELPWRIQVAKQKTVYFFCTYEHLAAKYQNNKVGVRLFGLWKIYSQIYNKKGWRFNLVCTFLQG